LGPCLCGGVAVATQQERGEIVGGAACDCRVCCVLEI